MGRLYERKDSHPRREDFFCEALTCTCKAWVLPFQSESKGLMFLSDRNSVTDSAAEST